MGVDTGRATTRPIPVPQTGFPPHPLPALPVPQTGFPYYTANRPAKAVYRRGRGGCGRGDGALVAARSCPPSPLFSLFERYWALVVARPVPSSIHLSLSRKAQANLDYNRR